MDVGITSTHVKNGSIDKFTIVKAEKKLEFAFFKANGVYFVNINNDHIIDYKQFCRVKSLKQSSNGSDVVLCIGASNMAIKNCDVQMVQKALIVMSDFMKTKSSLYKDLMYILFH